MRTSLLPCLIAATGLALAGCQDKVHRPACPAGQVCLEYGNNAEPLTLDPQRSNLVDEATIISDLIVGLTTDAPDGGPTPALATSWETSADGLIWTFHLRDAQWSDGVPVTADDFVYAYRRILDPKTASIYAYLVYILKNGEAVNRGKAAPETLGARALDPHTLQLTLEHPAPYLPELAKHQSFFPVPRHVLERYGDAWVRPGRFVGDGPFNLVSWSLGDKIQVAKNPRFWDAKHVCVDRINYYPTPDLVSAERRVQRGELDLNTSFLSNRLARMNQVLPGYARPHMSLATSYLAFNTHDWGAPTERARASRPVGGHRPRLHHGQTDARRPGPRLQLRAAGDGALRAGRAVALGERAPDPAADRGQGPAGPGGLHPEPPAEAGDQDPEPHQFPAVD